MNIFDVINAKQQQVECAMCGRKGVEMCMCSCESGVYYCGTSCQHQHWAVHRPTCAARHNGGSLSSCVNCGLTSQTLKSCPCKAALYCSVRCQREHWGTHRRMCSNWVSTFRRPMKKKRDMDAQTEVSVEEQLAEEKENLRRQLLLTANTTTTNNNTNATSRRRSSSSSSSSKRSAAAAAATTTASSHHLRKGDLPTTTTTTTTPVVIVDSGERKGSADHESPTETEDQQAD